MRILQHVDNNGLEHGTSKNDIFVIILSAVGTKDGKNSDVELVFN